jgi:Domain of unknown function (DUF4148)
MSLKYTALVAAVVTAFASQAVMAQDAASAPKTRAEVRTETKAAVKAGDVPNNAADQGLTKPKAKATEKRKSLREARAKERAEAKAAVKAGDVPNAAADQGLAKPKAKGAPKAPVVSEGGKTRAEVKAETKAAVKAGDVPTGEVPDMTKPKK